MLTHEQRRKIERCIEACRDAVRDNDVEEAWDVMLWLEEMIDEDWLHSSRAPLRADDAEYADRCRARDERRAAAHPAPDDVGATTE